MPLNLLKFYDRIVHERAVTAGDPSRIDHDVDPSRPFQVFRRRGSANAVPIADIHFTGETLIPQFLRDTLGKRKITVPDRDSPSGGRDPFCAGVSDSPGHHP